MARDWNEREDREQYWRRQEQNREQNREPQDRWSTGNREDEFRWGRQREEGRNWQDEEFERRRREEEMRRREGRGEYGREEYGREGYGPGMQYGADWARPGHRQNWGDERSQYGRDWRQDEGQRSEGRNEGRFGREGAYGGREWQGGRGWEGNRGFEGDRGWEGNRGSQSNRGREGYESQGRGQWGERERERERERSGGQYGGQQGGQYASGFSREAFGSGSMTGREGQWGGEGLNQATGSWRGGDYQRERGMRGMEGQHTGRGPRNYKRSDQRIEEDINEQLTRHPMIDASEIDIAVQNCDVTLRGNVDNRDAKRIAEDIAENVFGVKDVNNQIKVRQRSEQEGRQQQHETDATKQHQQRKVS